MERRTDKKAGREEDRRQEERKTEPDKLAGRPEARQTEVDMPDKFRQSGRQF